jgi:hypothetical protein
MGIDSIPGALESAFPKIIAKAEELGKLIGTSISDAVNGDTQRLILVGSLIGDLIKEGFKLSLRGMTDIAGQFYLEKLESQKYNPISEISRNLGLAEKHKLGAEYQGKKAIRESVESISKNYAEALAFIPQKQGPHPTMRGISYAPASHPSRMVDEKGHRIMFDIKTGIDALNQKLAPQP